MVFPVRTDPVLVDKKAILENTSLTGVEEPDQPGQLPLSGLKGLDDRRNPFFVGLAEHHSTAESHEQLEKAAKEKRERVKGAFFDPTTLPAKDRDALQAALQQAFGTPAAPKIDAKVTQVPQEHIDGLKLGKAKAEGQKEARDWLREGGRLYRLHCMQCHGLTGDGRGPTAKWVNPHPRDYRPGQFKFMSVNMVAPKSPGYPRRADLFRTVKFGIEGTTMPAHNLLPDDEIEAMVSYVIFLSVRGEAELNWLSDKSRPDIKSFLFGESGGDTDGFIKKTVQGWYESQDEKFIIKPGPYKVKADGLQDSVVRGERLFLSAGCASCHIDYGRRALYKLDEAGWGILVRPANLVAGSFRGGRRPIDLYWRLHSGIPGSGMSSHFRPDTPGATGALSNDEIWDVVNFLHALPYPAMRRQHGLKVN
jgi:mono/diheme cytochrome c family protein